MTDYTYKDESILLRYGYNNSSKAHVVMQLHGGVDDLKRFEGLDGKPFMMALIPLDYDNPELADTSSVSESEPSPAHSAGETGQSDGRTGGQFVKDLLLSNIFSKRVDAKYVVMEKVGTDKAFRDWIKVQPSCVSGKPAEVAHHVNFIEGEGHAGKGKKYDYSCVPLTNAEHDLLHRSGHARILDDHNKRYEHTPKGALEWFQKAAAKWRWEWATTQILETFARQALPGRELTSRADVPVITWRAWFDKHDITLLGQLR